jgi:hypothetical protein
LGDVGWEVKKIQRGKSSLWPFGPPPPPSAGLCPATPRKRAPSPPGTSGLPIKGWLRHQFWANDIICQQVVGKLKNKMLVEYLLKDINKIIGVNDYEVTKVLPDTFKSSLPSIENIKSGLEEI